MASSTRADAQARIDQIQQFRRELQELASSGNLELTDAQRSQLEAHHSALIARLSREFDIDPDTRSRQLSRGMQIASFLGAISLAASVFFLFYKFWGRLTTPAQATILMLAPVLTFSEAFWIRTRDSTGYFAKLAALVAFACFVLDLHMLGQIFNMTPTPNAFLAWSAFAFVCAYGLDSRLLLVAALICITAFVAARVGTWSGMYWIDFGTRPENFFPAAGLMLLAAAFIDHRKFDGFAATYRVTGLLSLFLPILVLSNWAAGSYAEADPELIKGTYQFVGFFLAGVVIWAGIRRQWPDVVNLGVTFFVIFLYTKFYDWWWDIMPKYLFFLVSGLTALLVLTVLRRLRRAVHGSEKNFHAAR